MSRLLIIGLLALALPIKAMAGLVLWGCGPGHHGASPHGLHAAAGGPASHHGMVSGLSPRDAALTHDHVAKLMTSLTAAADDVVDAVGEPPQERTDRADRCSACTPCSVTLAPAPDGTVSPDRVLRAVWNAPRHDVHVNPVADVPLEPPRPRLT